MLYEQLKAQLSDDSLKNAKDILEKLKQGEKVQQINKELQGLFRPSVQAFMASWMDYDPRKEIAELDIPVLLVGGGRDLQVPVSEAELLQESRPNAEMLILEK